MGPEEERSTTPLRALSPGHTESHTEVVLFKTCIVLKLQLIIGRSVGQETRYHQHEQDTKQLSVFALKAGWTPASQPRATAAAPIS